MAPEHPVWLTPWPKKLEAGDRVLVVLPTYDETTTAAKEFVRLLEPGSILTSYSPTCFELDGGTIWFKQDPADGFRAGRMLTHICAPLGLSHATAEALRPCLMEKP